MLDAQDTEALSDDDRLDSFHEWARTVRDPARQASEGIRRLITANRKASAEYEIAPLPDQRYALHFRLSYHSGTMSGHGSPWEAYENREGCVDAFLAAAQRHFGREINEHDICVSQQEARRQMMVLLKGGLFGFVEPEPNKEKR